MVELRFIYALTGVYKLAKDYMQVLRGVCFIVGGKIFFGREKL